MSKLADKLLACQVLVINDETYFGKAVVDRENDSVQISEAVEVTDSEKGNFKEVVKKWIKSDNSGKLELLNVTGLSTLTEKPLTKERKMEIASIAAQAEYVMENTVSDLQNERIDDI